MYNARAREGRPKPDLTDGRALEEASELRAAAEAAMTARTRAEDGLMDELESGLPDGYHPSWNHWRTMAATAAIAGAAIDVPDMSCTALAFQSTLVADAEGGGAQLAEVPAPLNAL